ncbi:hypothetical protein F4703DRAFT_1793478 [Phycomyces blakesleeanus]
MFIICQTLDFFEPSFIGYCAIFTIAMCVWFFWIWIAEHAWKSLGQAILTLQIRVTRIHALYLKNQYTSKYTPKNHLLVSNEEAAHAELFSIMAQHNYSYQRNNCMTSPVSRTINPMPNDTLFCTVHAATIATVRAVTAAHRGQDCVAPERGFVLPADACVPMGKTRSYSTNSGEMATVY